MSCNKQLRPMPNLYSHLARRLFMLFHAFGFMRWHLLMTNKTAQVNGKHACSCTWQHKILHTKCTSLHTDMQSDVVANAMALAKLATSRWTMFNCSRIFKLWRVSAKTSIERAPPRRDKHLFVNSSTSMRWSPSTSKLANNVQASEAVISAVSKNACMVSFSNIFSNSAKVNWPSPSSNFTKRSVNNSRNSWRLSKVFSWSFSADLIADSQKNPRVDEFAHRAKSWLTPLSSTKLHPGVTENNRNKTYFRTQESCHHIEDGKGAETLSFQAQLPKQESCKQMNCLT